MEASARNNDDDDDDDEDEEDDEEEDEEGASAPETATPAATAAGANNEPILSIKAVANLDSLYGLREIGREALCWQLSSAKPGNGVEQIRDQSTDTYWQSDGVSQPHWIQVHFARRVAISHVCLFLDYNLDESYTPKTLNVKVGMTTQDLVPAIHPPQTVIELNEPVGWCIIPLQAPPDPLDELVDEEEDEDNENNDADAEDKAKFKQRALVRTHMIQICILSMHQNGRDTHVRQVQLYGPRSGTTGFPVSSFSHAMDAPKLTAAANAYRAIPSASDEPSLVPDFTSELSQFSLIR